MNIERILKSLFDAGNLAVLFFLVACFMFIQYRGLDRELEECRYWSSKAYSRLSPAAKRELDEEFQLHVDMQEHLADRRR